MRAAPHCAAKMRSKKRDETAMVGPPLVGKRGVVYICVGKSSPLFWFCLVLFFHFDLGILCAPANAKITEKKGDWTAPSWFEYLLHENRGRKATRSASKGKGKQQDPKKREYPTNTPTELWGKTSTEPCESSHAVVKSPSPALFLFPPPDRMRLKRRINSKLRAAHNCKAGGVRHR